MRKSKWIRVCKVRMLFLFGMMFFGSVVYAKDLASVDVSSYKDFKQAEIKEVRGDARVKLNPTASWKVADIGMMLEEGAELRTGAESVIILVSKSSGGVDQVDLQSHSWMRIAKLRPTDSEGSKKTLFDLSLGKVLVQVAALKGKSSFQIRTATSMTTVKGEATFEVQSEEP